MLGESVTMALFRNVLSAFDEALDWPDDPLLDDDEPVTDWSRDANHRGRSVEHALSDVCRSVA
jgi:hypothetical protein